MKSEIISIDDNGMPYSVVDDIAKYCEVKNETVRRLILSHMDDFIGVTLKIKESLRSDLKSEVPNFGLETSKSGASIDWDSTRLYQPHVELLLMFMKNTKVVSDHKVDLIADFFVTKVELAMAQIENHNLLLSVEKERNTKLELIAAEKFRTYGDFKPLSKWKYELGIKETTTELMDILDDCGVIRTEEIIQKKRFAVDMKNVKREAGANIVFNRHIIEKHLSHLSK